MAVVSYCFKVKTGKQRLFRNRYDFGKIRIEMIISLWSGIIYFIK